MPNNRLCKVLMLFMLIASLSAVSLGRADTGPVAYIDRVLPESQKLRDVAKITRAGRLLSVSNESISLYPDDQIVVTDPRAVVIVRYLADNTVEGVRNHASGSSNAQIAYIIKRPQIPALPSSIGAWLMAQLKGADQSNGGVTVADSRAADKRTCYNTTGQTDQPIEFSMPVFAADRSQIVAGNRSLFVSWRGGAAPFSVKLVSSDTGSTVSELLNIRDLCSATLPQADLKPGRYQLTVIDMNGKTEEETHLIAVTQMPDMPATLRDAALPDNERDLYYNTWLSATDGGRWAFEAMQHVAAMDCQWQPAQEWLERWGGLPRCRS